MRAEILSIGTELLVGAITNTNARFLSEKLAASSIDVYHQAVVGDNVGRILQAFETAARRADLIVTSGGLGPTEDDVTLESVLRFTQTKAVWHEGTYRHISDRLKRAGYRMTKLAERQCWVPEGASVFRNDNGAAPGLLCRTERAGETKWVLVLPGPPRELEPMLLEKALPELFRRSGFRPDHFVIRDVKITGFTETQVAEKVPDLLRSRPPLTTGIYAKPDLITLKIMAKDPSLRAATAMVDAREKTIRRRLGTAVFGADADTLALAVGKLLSKKKKTLAVAESCTGGLLGCLVTDVPGSSKYFQGGVLAYDNRVKSRELGVPEATLRKYGAVSEETAAAMAEGARQKFGTDYGVAITGIAGPDGGSEEKPVGLVYVAVASEGKTRVKKNLLRGKRREIKERAANRALDFLRLVLLGVSPA